MKGFMARVLVVALVGSVAILPLGCKSEQSAEEKTSGEPTTSIRAADLGADYKGNPLAADEKYKSKVLRVDGTIEAIGKDDSDTLYVTLSTYLLDWDLKCTFSDDQIDELTKLRKDQWVTLRGICEGHKANTVLLRGCLVD